MLYLDSQHHNTYTMHANYFNSAELTPERFQILPSLSYSIRKLLRNNLPAFQLLPSLERVIDPLHDLDAALTLLYPDRREMNAVVLELEKLVLSYQNIRVSGNDHHPGLQKIQHEVFWWLGYELRSASPYTILVVDDVLENTLLVSNLLKRLGYRIYTESSGQMALNLLQEIQPDLICLDLQMPGMNGYQLLQALRQIDHLRFVPVFFLSADDTVEHRQKVQALGAIGSITKPFKAATFLEQVQQYLGRSVLTNPVSSSLETRRDRAKLTSCVLCDSNQAGFQVTLDGRYLRVNTRLAQLCGYPSISEMISEITNVWDQIYCNPHHRMEWNRCITYPNQVIQFTTQICDRKGNFRRVVEHIKGIEDDYQNFLLYEGSMKLQE